jgi:hypothetical protein
VAMAVSCASCAAFSCCAESSRATSCGQVAPTEAMAGAGCPARHAAARRVSSSRS